MPEERFLVVRLSSMGDILNTLPAVSALRSSFPSAHIAWLVSDNTTLRFSTGVGLTHESSPVLFRFGYSYEIQGIGNKLSRLFGVRR